MNDAIVPDGRYQVVVEQVTLTQPANSSNPAIYWVLRVTGPTHVGRIIGKEQRISMNSLRWVKQELHLCGLDPEPFSTLPALLPQLRGLALEIRKRTREPYENIYFDRRIAPGA
jgi:hypothetical protein